MSGSFNRTIVELKYFAVDHGGNLYASFNRTIVELKYAVSACMNSPYLLLIVLS